VIESLLDVLRVRGREEFSAMVRRLPSLEDVCRISSAAGGEDAFSPFA
jgi:hypothetical protein